MNEENKEYALPVYLRALMVLVMNAAISLALSAIALMTMTVHGPAVQDEQIVKLACIIYLLTIAWWLPAIGASQLIRKMRATFPAMQGAVDARLTSLANALEDGFAEENRLQATCLRLPDDDRLNEDLEIYQRTNKKTKKEFWRTHAFASSLGFEVRNSWKLYSTRRNV